jgi:hypothetical protein
LIAKQQKFRGQIEDAQFSRRNSVVPRRTVHPLPPLEQKNLPEKEKKCWLLLDPLTQPNLIHIVDQVVYHKSHFVSVFITPRCVINVKKTHHQQSNNGRTVGVLIPPNTKQKK